MIKNKVDFFIPLKKIPTKTFQQKRVGFKNGKPIFYEDEKLADVRALFMSRLMEFKLDKVPSGSPIELVTTWCFPETKQKKHGHPMVSKPDLDNLQKLLNDCLTECGFFKDDSYIYRMILEKFHSNIVGIRISIRYMEEIKKWKMY